MGDFDDLLKSILEKLAKNGIVAHRFFVDDDCDESDNDCDHCPVSATCANAKHHPDETPEEKIAQMCDVFPTDDGCAICLEVVGEHSREDLGFAIQNKQLIVSIPHQKDRHIDLPMECSGKLRASLLNGILTIRLKKA